MKPRIPSSRGQRGMSLVELMIGVVIGLIVVAAAIVMAATQLTENRKLLLETQLQQDMRATMDIMTREIRRAGHWDSPASVWTARTPDVEPQLNPYRQVSIVDDGRRIQFSYQRPQRSAAGTDFAYFSEGGVVKADTFRDNALVSREPLTDDNVVQVVRLVFAQVPAAGAFQAFLTCPKLCPGGTEDCWPRFSSYDIEITLEAEAVAEPLIRRTLRSRVRVRGDGVESHMSPSAATKLCPQ